MSRPFHVYDYEGEHLGSFATWDLAHEWAHLQAVLNGVPTPLQVEDRATAGRRRVWADRCEPLGGGPLGGASFDGGSLDGDQLGGDLLAYGPCSAVATPAFAPPRPRQPDDFTDSGIDFTDGGLTDARLADARLAEG